MNASEKQSIRFSQLRRNLEERERERRESKIAEGTSTEVLSVSSLPTQLSCMGTGFSCPTKEEQNNAWVREEELQLDLLWPPPPPPAQPFISILVTSRLIWPPPFPSAVDSRSRALTSVVCCFNHHHDHRCQLKRVPRFRRSKA